ncbi:MAG: HAD-like domain-containing protein [Benniella sp.]|nr:MAG: HAD-like domain-containing protein [Benniella sp.]
MPLSGVTDKPTPIGMSKDDSSDSATLSNNNELASPNAWLYYNAEALTFYPFNGIRAITPSYMSIAHQEPVTLPKPRKLLVILDLNGTLFYRADNIRRTSHQRPHLSAFLSYLFENCRVMIWSSARPTSIEKMLKTSGFDQYQRRLDRIWSRMDFRLSPIDYHRKVLTLKDLEYVWEAIENERRSASEDELVEGGKFGMRYDQTNTILIDDSHDKSQLQPYNCIVVPEYNNVRFKAGDDTELLKIRMYMETLVRQQNVSAYMRTHPFDSANCTYSQEAVKLAAQRMKNESKRARRARKKLREQAKKAAAAAKAPPTDIKPPLTSRRKGGASKKRKPRPSAFEQKLKKASSNGFCSAAPPGGSLPGHRPLPPLVS